MHKSEASPEAMKAMEVYLQALECEPAAYIKIHYSIIHVIDKHICYDIGHRDGVRNLA